MVTHPGFFLTPRQDSEDQDCQLLITSVTHGWLDYYCSHFVNMETEGPENWLRREEYCLLFQRTWVLLLEGHMVTYSHLQP